jgi:hypothetical protein
VFKSDVLFVELLQKGRGSALTTNGNPLSQEQEEVISRREITKKVAYVPPAILAVIAASQRPAIAASHTEKKEKDD